MDTLCTLKNGSSFKLAIAVTWDAVPEQSWLLKLSCGEWAIRDAGWYQPAGKLRTSVTGSERQSLGVKK